MKKESREPNHRQVKTHGFLDAKSRLNIIRITGKRDDIFQYDIQKGLNSVNFFIKHSYVFFQTKSTMVTTTMQWREDVRNW